MDTFHFRYKPNLYKFCHTFDTEFLNKYTIFIKEIYIIYSFSPTEFTITFFFIYIENQTSLHTEVNEKLQIYKTMQ